jgi:para-aminobenzoate synthetase component 1
MKNIILDWQNPIEIAAKIKDNYFADWVFLSSNKESENKKSKSYLAIFPKEQIISEDFFSAEKIIKENNKKWFGYISYEAAWQFEKMPQVENSQINLAKIWLINFSLIAEFDHAKKVIKISYENAKYLVDFNNLIDAKKNSHHQDFDSKINQKNISVIDIKSNFSDQKYLENINKIKAEIENGDFFQANLTRKFFGSFNQKIDQFKAFNLFEKLCQMSPANYSSFLKLDNNFIVSSSPELFLKAKNNKIISKPIKGTSPRFQDKKQDLASKKMLKKNSKEKAENLMIVDLVRNDLARICKSGSVKVKNLFKINSYANIHHMSSEIIGKIDDRYYAFDALKYCFPAGSMTGAPKIKAMESIATKEKITRGVYSGAIGIFAKNYLNLSVVIRTIIIKDDKFEFQVGGGITYDSNDEMELKEIFDKGKAIQELLKINSLKH